LGCKSAFAAQHSSHDNVVIDGCNIWRIEHASLIIHLKAFWNANIFRTEGFGLALDFSPLELNFENY
jgi:hypothetical protein